MNFRRLAIRARDVFSKLRGLFGQSSASETAAVLDQYVDTFPTAQNAVDVVPGWNHAFPPHLGLKTGDVHLYHDDRILWCLEQAGPLAGRKILELGPLEGMHTFMLANAGAAHIDAVEANRLAFLRCLITREILKFPNASFLHGDFVRWLEQPELRYDLIVASGVLYHSPDPIRLIELIGRAADAFYLWTHYYGFELRDDPRRLAFSGVVNEQQFRGQVFRVYERHYYRAWKNPKFCGGLHDRHYWMSKDDLLRLIDLLGFHSVIAHDMPGHVNGPSISIFARRKDGAGAAVPAAS